MSEQDPNDDLDPYLWDRTGPADPAVEQLERTLGVLRHHGRLPALPPQRASRKKWRTSASWLAAAAALAIAVSGGWWMLSMRRPAWSVVAISGLPAVGGQTVSSKGRLATGEWLVTDGASRARVAVRGIGSVDVEPNTRIQLVKSAGSEHRMALDRGMIHARIWAPPKFFYVNTKAAVAVDLGCAYTLQVDGNGVGLLRVTRGWVGFERDGRDTYVPEGAVCVTRDDLGPGTPRYEDAPSGYGEALLRLDFGAADDPQRAAALDHVLKNARPRDALSLWHLLTRGTRDERLRVYDRLAELVAPPVEVTREKVLAGDREALNTWWNRLGVETSTWWRLFKKKW